MTEEAFSPDRRHYQFDFARDVEVLRTIRGEMHLDEAGFAALVATVGRLERERDVGPLLAIMAAGAPRPERPG